MRVRYALDQIRRRIAEYEDTSDPRGIMAEDISALLDTLTEEAGRRPEPDAITGECLSAAAAVLWYTADHVEEAHRLTVRRSAVGIAAMIYPIAPHLLPTALAQVCAREYDGPRTWNEQATELLTSTRPGDLAAVDKAIILLRQAVSAAPEEHPSRAAYLANLAHACRKRFEVSGLEPDLDNAIAAYRESLAAVVLPGERAGYLADLGLALRQRFTSFGDQDALRAAIGVLEEAVDVADDDNADRWRCLNNLANALRDLFRLMGDGAALDRAITLHRQATACIPVEDPFNVNCVANLGGGLRERFDRSAAAADLIDALTAFRTAVESAAATDPAMPMLLDRLTTTVVDLLALCDHTAEWAAAEDALAAAQRLLPPARPRPFDAIVEAAWAQWRAVHSPTHPQSFPRQTTTSLFNSSARKIENGLNHDVRDIADDRTATEITTLLQRAAIPAAAPLRPSLAAAVAWTAWLRYLVLPLGRAEAERQLAVTLFAALVRETSPETSPADSVPDSVREVLSSAGSPDGRGLSGTELAALAKKIAFTAERAESGRDPQLVADAIDLGDRFLAASPEDHPDLAQTLANLAAVYSLNVETGGDLTDLDKALDSGQRALRLAKRPSDRRSAYMNVAAATQLRAERLNTDAALDEAIAALRTLLPSAGAGEGGRPMLALADLLTRRYARRTDLSDLDEAIGLFDEFLSTSHVEATDSNDMVGVLARHGYGLLWRYKETRQPADLDRAYESLSKAWDAQSDNAAVLLGALADVCQERAKLSHDMTELSHVIDLLRDKADGQDTEPVRRLLLHELADSLSLRAKYSHEPDDFDGALAAYRQVLALPIGDNERVGVLTSIGLLLADRAEEFGSWDDLVEAIRHHQDALAGLPPEHPGRSIALGNLGVALTARAQWTGSRDDFDAAEAAVREAIDATTRQGKDVAWLYANLGAALDARFRNSARSDDINAALEAHRGAAAAATRDPGYHLSNLGVVFRVRSQYTGDVTDLEHAVSTHRRAVEATPPGHPDHAKRLSRYAVALQALAEWVDDPDRLRLAVDIHRDALNAAPPHGTQRVQCQISLGSALGQLARRVDAPSGADEAVTLLRSAAAFPGNDPDVQGAIANNLGAQLLDRFVRDGNRADLDEACELLERAVRAAPAGTAMYAKLSDAAGNALTRRFEITGSASDRDKALDRFWAAIEGGQADHSHRIRSARALADLAMTCGRPADGLRALRIATDLLLALTWQVSNRRSSQYHLARAGGLASDAAACAIACGDVTAAVELFEAGRGVQWAHMLNLRTEMTQVAEADPELARRLADIGRALEASPDDTEDGRAVDRRLALTQEWDELVDRVRAYPGLERFLKPPSFDALVSTLAGPAVVVNVSRWRSDALIVTASGVRTVPLPKVTHAGLAELVHSYLTALIGLDAPQRRYHSTLQRIQSGEHSAELYRRYHEATTALNEAQEALEGTLDEVLRRLWDEIVEPVLTALGCDDQPSSPSWPRVWWCPAGLLTLLPLHAAGYHKASGDHPPRSASDRVISSYTPTLRALRESAVRPQRPGTDMLIVAVPDAAGQVPLPSVTRERDLLVSMFADRHTLLEGPAATATAVRTALPRHRYVHLSCHGAQDLADPSRGGLLLHDAQLTITELAAQHHDGEFAFLSACHTATGGLEVPDEAVTLVSALHYTGYRHVIGALWSIYDRVAAHVAEEVYSALAARDTFAADNAARALHHAIRKLRDLHHLPLSVWCTFIHTGP